MSVQSIPVSFASSSGITGTLQGGCRSRQLTLHLAHTQLAAQLVAQLIATLLTFPQRSLALLSTSAPLS